MNETQDKKIALVIDNGAKSSVISGGEQHRFGVDSATKPYNMLASTVSENRPEKSLLVPPQQSNVDYPLDQKNEIPQAGAMNNVTRDELNAKLEAHDAKAEIRAARFEERLNNAINNLADTTRELKENLRRNNDSLEMKIEAQKRTIWGATAVTIATVLTGYALVFQAFDTGRDTAALSESASQSVKNASELLNKIQSRLDDQVNNTKVPLEPISKSAETKK